MEVISKKRLVDQIYEVLKKEIINGNIKQGSRINIKKFSEEFGISESPVRSAVNRLVSEGFVQVLPRRGYFAIQLNEKNLEEIHDVRIMLELYAINKCVVNKENRERFEKMYEALKKLSQESKAKKRLQKSLELDKFFHLEIIRDCENSRVQEFFFQIYDFIQLCQSLKDLNEQEVVQEHLAILKSLLEGSKEEAKKKLILHLENAKKRNIETLRRERLNTSPSKNDRMSTF